MLVSIQLPLPPITSMPPIASTPAHMSVGSDLQIVHLALTAACLMTAVLKIQALH